MQRVTVENKELTLEGRLVKTARLSAEGYEFLEQPERMIQSLRECAVKADLLTFTEPLSGGKERNGYLCEPESLAVLSITDYETWWKRQINDKTRNMIRKAEKKGVVIKVVPFSDELISGIESIHNEHPLRQGRPFKHYGKPFEQVKRDHESYLERSDFIGAYYNDELIGFIKLVHSAGWSNLMQIISKISHRDKAPTNALLAKSVEICAQRGVGSLQYGVWSTRGIGDFKLHHNFKRVEVPRYFVPLSATGSLVIGLKLHRGLPRLIPEAVSGFFLNLRSKYYTHKFRNHAIKGAVA